MTHTSLLLLPVSKPTSSSQVFVEGRGDVDEAGEWCRLVGHGNEPQTGIWNDLHMPPNLQQPATRRFSDQSLPLPTT